MIASARLYEWAPSLPVAWRRLLEWVAARAGLHLEIVESRSLSLDDLWARDDLGCVFMCGYPSALREHRPAALLAAHEAPELAGVLADLLLLRFHRVTPDDFQVLLDWQRDAENAGYPTLR